MNASLHDDDASRQIMILDRMIKEQFDICVSILSWGCRDASRSILPHFPSLAT